ERTEFRRDAEGRVKVTLTKKGEDGQEKTETFEAESLDALAQSHPEVHARVRPLAGGGFLVTPGFERFRVRIPEIRMPEFRTWAGNVDEWARSRDFWRDGVTGAKPVLGVMLSAVPPVLRTQCGIAENEGVVVESVIEGSLASRLSLQKHDVLLAVNGLPVSSATEVRSAVEAVKEGGEVRLRVLRAGKHQDLSGTR
ncbi:MAG TPA: PDZ domain-containing protein, partial [Planctomycetota bacterium]|nr:PDZ domain-containing protein [Planctomycetota bacterium]